MTRELTDSERHTVNCVRQQACAYVWGRRDAGDEDTTDSGAFGDAYAARQTAYFTEGLRGVPDLEAAFLEWRKTGAITTGI